MISKAEALSKFREIIGSAASWAQLLRSQFVEHFSIFQSWALRDALWKLERAEQEAFLSTAINRSSIVSHVEDREYIPRKPAPATGTVMITNRGANTVSIPLDQPFVSEGQVAYASAEAVVIAAGESDEVAFEQVEVDELFYVVLQEQPYFEILFDADMTPRIQSFRVYVDESGGESFEEWEPARLFQNTDAESTVFDEFYSHMDQLGIRFGNGLFGKIPPLGANIKVVFRLTDGDTFLLNNQRLHVVGDLLDYGGQQANLSAVSATSIAGGRDIEETEEIRRSLHYWPIYNEKMVWREDYIFFLKRLFPGILWINVWGETEATAENNGVCDLDFINKIFVSAYVADPEFDTETELLAALNDPRTRPLNRRFEWKAPLLTPFTLSISGRVSVSENIGQVRQAIVDVLRDAYGLDSANRRDEFVLKDAYELVSGTGYFGRTGDRFEISGWEDADSPALNEMVYLDVDGSTIEIAYD